MALYQYVQEIYFYSWCQQSSLLCGLKTVAHFKAALQAATLCVVFTAWAQAITKALPRGPHAEKAARPAPDWLHTQARTRPPRPSHVCTPGPGSLPGSPCWRRGLVDCSPLWFSPQCFSILCLFPFRVQSKGRLPRRLRWGTSPSLGLVHTGKQPLFLVLPLVYFITVRKSSLTCHLQFGFLP